jgi:hypothetical protein
MGTYLLKLKFILDCTISSIINPKVEGIFGELVSSMGALRAILTN